MRKPAIWIDDDPCLYDRFPFMPYMLHRDTHIPLTVDFMGFKMSFREMWEIHRLQHEWTATD